MAIHRPFIRTPLAAAAALLLAQAALAQTSTTLPAATVTGRAETPTATIGGFGDAPLAATPITARVLDESLLKDRGMQSLADATRLDASVSDAYNAEGYWTFFTIRGFVTDNRFNFRRDGLPINAETVLPLESVSRIEILKGASGIQAGTSAPGGLVNLVVKRPDVELTSATLGVREKGTLGGAVDVSRRFGTNQAFGLRVNAAYEHLDPQVRDARGHRRLLAVAGDWRLGDATLVEAEFETSRHVQPSQPGFSLLGATVPDAGAIDPRINLNNQPWAQPSVFDNHSGSLRITHKLDADWSALAHFGAQRLRTDDRTAFPFGCSTEGNFDRFCSDGTMDIYDFRSENERRRSDALDLGLRGRATTGAVSHRIEGGVLLSRFESRFQRQAFNFAGTGNIAGTLVTPPAPDLTDENTNRDERSTELYLRDTMRLGDWSLWAGLRHARLHRESVRTDGSRPTSYAQTNTTPWLALGWQLAPQTLAYASWGRGVESEVAPNRPRYANAGEALPALQSRQVEAGLKHAGETVGWTLAAFEIVRPQFADLGANCADDSTPGSCTRRADGQARHRGLEAELGWRLGAVALNASALLLDAKLRDTSDPAVNGKRPVNVPEQSLRLGARWDVGALPGLALNAAVVHEGDRAVLPDNSVTIPSWTRLDLGARFVHRVAATTLTWRLGLDNATDRRAWKESPLEFGHVYLFPLAPRTAWLSVQADL